MVVDLVRRCYRSKWRLFSDSEQLVSGRYYEAPPGTPAYPFFHMYGSRDWDQKPNEIPPPFGESRTAAHRWDPGQLPVDVPLPVAVGSRGCAAGPRPISTAVPFDETLDGWLPACLGIPANLLKWYTYTSFMRCTTQLLWAWVICELYDANFAPITALLVKLLGDIDVVYYPRIGLSTYVSGEKYPRFVVARNADWCIVACEGTTNAQQGSLEFLYSPLGPTQMGAYSTHQYWQDIANRILRCMEQVGYTAGTPVFLCGHSLGGAAVLVLAAMLRLGNADVKIRYYTFGAPAIGDGRLAKILSKCEGICLDNVGDIVPALPFGFAEVGAAVPLVGIGLITVLDKWISAPRHWRQFANGVLDPGRELVQVSATIVQIYVDVALGVVISPIDAHRTSEYIRRMRLRCPGPSWPILDTVDYLTLTSCTPDAFGWLNLGGEVVPRALAGAIALGGRRGVACVDAIPVVLDRLYTFIGDTTYGGGWLRLYPTTAGTIYITFAGGVFGDDAPAVWSGSCGALNFETQLHGGGTYTNVAVGGGDDLYFQGWAGAGFRVFTLWLSKTAGAGPAIPSGALSLGGDIPGPPATVTPALTCAAAPLLSLNTIYHVRAVYAHFGDFQWIAFPWVAGTTYTVTVSSSSSDGIWNMAAFDGTCSTIVFEWHDFSADGSSAHTATGAYLLLNCIQLTSPYPTYVEFDIEVT